MKKILLLFSVIILLSGASYGQDTTTVYGCMDPGATNFNPYATVDDGSCTYDTSAVYGCMDPGATNFNPDATVDDGSCQYDVQGCTDTSANNYDPSATTDDGSCFYGEINNDLLIKEVLGCTDQNAENYLSAATKDNGSCVYSQEYLNTATDIPGCMDVSALNYNENATVSNSSCIYDQDTVFTPIDLSGRTIDESVAAINSTICDVDYSRMVDSASIAAVEVISATEVTLLWNIYQGANVFEVTQAYTLSVPIDNAVFYLTVSCETSTRKIDGPSRTFRSVKSGVVTATYGSPRALEPSVYPNPVTEVLHIQGLSNDNVRVEMYNAKGSKVYEQLHKGSDQIDVSGLVEGVYLIRVISGDQVILQEKVLK
jgi:hypothetical protein